MYVALAKRLIDQDFPTLGICFGLQALSLASGGKLVDGFGETYRPPVSALLTTVTATRLPPTQAQFSTPTLATHRP